MEIKEFVKSAVKRELTPDQIAEFFNRQPENSVEETLKHLSLRRDWAGFDRSFEDAIFAMPDYRKAFWWYVQWYICTVDEERCNREVRQLSRPAQVKMVELPDITQLIRQYARYHTLCEEAEAELFKNDDNFDAYVDRRELTDTGVESMLALPEDKQQQFLELYFLRHKLREDQEFEMIEKVSFNSPALKSYIERYGLSQKVNSYLAVMILQGLTGLSKQAVAFAGVNTPIH